MSAVQYSIWFAAAWLTLTTAMAIWACWKVSRLQREFDELSEELKGLVVAEQRRFLKEINTPKNETRRRQKVDAKKNACGLATGAASAALSVGPVVLVQRDDVARLPRGQRSHKQNQTGTQLGAQVAPTYRSPDATNEEPRARRGRARPEA